MTKSATLRDYCFRRKGEYVTRLIAGDSIVVPVRGQVGDLNAIYNLNEVGAFIWNLIDGETSVHSIMEAVCQDFEVARDQAEQDVALFLGTLESAGMVQRSEANR